MKPSPLILGAALAGVGSFAVHAAAESKIEVVARVNGVSLTAGQIEALIAQAQERGHKDSPELRAAAKERLIVQAVLAQEAARMGMDREPDTASMLAQSESGILANALVAEFMANEVIPEAEVRREYDRLAGETGTTEYRVRQVLFEDEQAARELIVKLAAGGVFAELARQSMDTGSKDNGGDLGWAIPSRFAKPFADAVKRLSAGQHSDEPVKTEFGWHVMRVEETRQAIIPEYDSIRETLSEGMRRDRLEQLISRLRANAHIETD